MLFNSYVFILFFLPVCMIGYFGLNHFKKDFLAQLFLLGMSLWFYGYFNPSYLVIILVSIVINYLFSGVLLTAKKPILKKSLLIIALLFNVGILFYFKYYNFFIENVNQVFKTDFNLKNVVLPLGISFFTFQQLSYVIDSYWDDVPRYGFIKYASFVTYFPQLIAGPIVTHDELIPQFMDEEKKKFNWTNFSKGMYTFVLGLGKKVLIADNFGNAVNWGFANIGSLDTTNALLTMLSYTIQIYFDFSGYCDMAIGIGKMMNIDLPLNFNSPYKALTIAEFWQRWHMTLTRFFTKYIYIPLGGNRKGKIRTYLNVMSVFLISGLWHGANWTFILWGCLHGVFQVITRKWKKTFEKIHPALNWLITFLFVNVTWVLFRADSIRDALRLLNRIVKMNFGAIDTNILNAFQPVEIQFVLNNIPGGRTLLTHYPYIMVMVTFTIIFVATLGSKNVYEKMLEFKPTLGRLLISVGVMIWCIFSFAGVSTFLYFNF